MGRFSHASAVAALLGLGTLIPARSAAQERRPIWPEHAENLQVLPKDFAPDRLRAVMQGFTRALGVRCSHCHVGVEGEPLTTYDFASDENPNKDRARAMYRMLGTINQQLRDFPSSAPDARVNMWCHTCHNGKPRPQTLDEAVREAYDGAADDASPGEAALARFAELRARYFGAAAYDFTASNVNALASAYFQAGDTLTAVRFFERNVADFPDYAEGWESLGDVAAARGDRELARGYYEKAVALAPENMRIRRSLDAIR